MFYYTTNLICLGEGPVRLNQRLDGAVIFRWGHLRSCQSSPMFFFANLLLLRLTQHTITCNAPDFGELHIVGKGCGLVDLARGTVHGQAGSGTGFPRSPSKVGAAGCHCAFDEGGDHGDLVDGNLRVSDLFEMLLPLNVDCQCDAGVHELVELLEVGVDLDVRYVHKAEHNVVKGLADSDGIDLLIRVHELGEDKLINRRCPDVGNEGGGVDGHVPETHVNYVQCARLLVFGGCSFWYNNWGEGGAFAGGVVWKPISREKDRLILEGSE